MLNEGGPGESVYLVTAAHVARGLEGSTWFVRMNGPDGLAIDIRGHAADRWYYHADPSVDVAVMPLAPPRAEYILSYQTFIGDRDLKDRIGVGDVVFISGLFAYFEGEKQNLPIVRMGNIAMMPGEQRIPIDPQDVRGFRVDDIEGYLVEVRSRGGLSGSPCFVRATVQAELRSTESRWSPSSFGLSGHGREAARIVERLTPRLANSPLGLESRIGLLGLVFGHWYTPDSLKTDAVGDDADAGNAGIAVVVPASKILEVFRLPELRSRREEEAARIRAEHKARADAAEAAKKGPDDKGQ